MKKLIILIIIYICFILSNPLNVKNDKTYGPKHIPDNYVQPFVIINSKDDLVKVEFPCIFKPNRCSGGSKNVELIHNIKDAIKYLKNIDNIIAQKIHNGPYEVGVLYERHPFLKNGKIVSIVSKNLDNKWKALKCLHFGNYNSGTKCENKPTWITNKLENTINFIQTRVELDLKSFKEDIWAH